jgi:hypothetical protein
MMRSERQLRLRGSSISSATYISPYTLLKYLQLTISTVIGVEMKSVYG